MNVDESEKLVLKFQAAALAVAYGAIFVWIVVAYLTGGAR